MNKKGLILIFLFVLSTIGFLAVTNAETSNTKVDVRLAYVPPAYVPSGELYLEFDSRYLADNAIFGSDDVIYFAFFYDIVVCGWDTGYLETTGGGNQVDEWFYADENNVTEGYQGSDLYNITRYSGDFAVLLDDYNLGWSKIDMAAFAGTYQDIPLSLDIGWHYLTIVGSELVSDGNHTTWDWEYTKDQKKFYVAETRHDSSSVIQEAWYNYADVVATPTLSEDLPLAFNWTSWDDLPKPRASIASGNTYTVVEEGTEAAPIGTPVEAIYNASDTDLVLVQGPYTSAFANVFSMGPLTFTWFSNQNKMDFDNATYTVEELPLIKGQNYVYFILWGFKADPWSLGYGNPSPVLELTAGIARIFVGEPEATGPGFGIFISVSMLGLVAALYIMRRRK